MRVSHQGVYQTADSQTPFKGTGLKPDFPGISTTASCGLYLGILLDSQLLTEPSESNIPVYQIVKQPLKEHFVFLIFIASYTINSICK